MTPNPIPNTDILVLAVGMDARKQAVFRMAFKMHSKASYRMVDGDAGQHVHLAIVDIDSPEGPEIWRRFRTEYPHLPALIVSASPPTQAPAPVLQKPVRMESLFPQLEALRSGKLQAPVADAALVKPDEPAPQQVAPAGATKAEALPAQGQPSAAASQPVSIRPEDVTYFDPAHGLLGLLHMVQRDKMSAIIQDASNTPLLVAHPSNNEAQLLVEPSRLEALCRQDNSAFRARTPKLGDEFKAGNRQPLDALIWQVAIWSANGRLIRSLRLNTPVQLKYWPNLTRLAPIPGALRMAAFLTRSPVNPVLTSRMLQIPPKDLFNFLAASHSLELLVLPQANTGSAHSSSAGSQTQAEAAPQQSPTAPQKRGFLSRLLKKIAGI